jgi:hypothetical protein
MKDKGMDSTEEKNDREKGYADCTVDEEQWCMVY